ncbi:uncharacterized protein LOC110092989 [Dendrobium catenatum]|uniref:uncharacterized protein LOC110092989 n=1 Tax=Dendrobium catenatum TaxID=906689 RepID=UPI00109F5B09|nr:uncharacterized protein LOC110092989 [Dendrobium catenatum]
MRLEIEEQVIAETKKLIEAGFIREEKYADWITNIIPMKKKNGQIRICIDFRDLNKACPKDDFPLPISELLVDNTSNYDIFSFMDGSSGYNQIKMAPEDEKHTSFRTPIGIFCYTVMPFGLKNAGATYQRAMTHIFDELIHQKVECYVDDLVVKSIDRKDHLQDLRIVFERIRKFNLKMNPLKCAFGVSSGKFLGYVVRHRGIEVDPNKVKAIIEMPPPKSLRQLRSLQGQLAFIRRFISNLSGRCQPFAKLMKKDVRFKWDDECQEAFDSIKRYLLSPPILAAPIPGKPLILYTAALEESLGALLAQHNKEGKENALYYISRRLIGAEIRYSSIEKHCRLARWAVILLQFDITYVPQKAVKGQVLADFLAAHPVHADSPLNDDLPDEQILVVLEKEKSQMWEMYFDGASSIKPAQPPNLPKARAGIGLIFIAPNGGIMRFSFGLTEPRTNNEAEYEALIAGLEIAISMEIQNLKQNDWRQPFIDYYRENKLLADKSLATQIKKRALRYAFVNNTLYRRSFEQMWLHCLGRDEADKVISEVHEGLYGAHQSGPKMAIKVKRMGYYWPSMVKDCTNHADICHECQIHGNIIHQPPNPLHPTIASWPFECWGTDVIGPIDPPSSAGHRFILAVTDYFSKWAEAVPFKEVTAHHVINFFTHNIVYRFGVSRRIISDNGSAFKSTKIYKFTERHKIDWRYSSIYNPRANGLTEAFNKTLVKLLKKILTKNKRECHTTMAEALWAYRTTYKTPTKTTPYALVFGAEAVLQLEVELPSLRIALQYDLTEEQNARLRMEELDALDEGQGACNHFQWYDNAIKIKDSDCLLEKLNIPTQDNKDACKAISNVKAEDKVVQFSPLIQDQMFGQEPQASKIERELKDTHNYIGKGTCNHFQLFDSTTKVGKIEQSDYLLYKPNPPIDAMEAEVTLAPVSPLPLDQRDALFQISPVKRLSLADDSPDAGCSKLKRCLKFGGEGHWSNELSASLNSPCNKCGRFGYWKCNCPA